MNPTESGRVARRAVIRMPPASRRARTAFSQRDLSDPFKASFSESPGLLRVREEVRGGRSERGRVRRDDAPVLAVRRRTPAGRRSPCTSRPASSRGTPRARCSRSPRRPAGRSTAPAGRVERRGAPRRTRARRSARRRRSFAASVSSRARSGPSPAITSAELPRRRRRRSRGPSASTGRGGRPRARSPATARVAVAARERRRVVERLGRDPVEAREAVGRVLRVREDLPRLREARAVGLGDQLAPARVLGRRREVALRPSRTGRTPGGTGG